MTVTTGKVFTAIVLQGGGALGAYEYGVLTALYQARPGFKPVAVSGISIGAITAAVLGGNKDPLSALDALWRDKLTVEAPLPLVGLPAFIDHSLAVFGNPGMYRMNGELLTAPWKATSIYDTAPLRQTLSELVDPQVLNDQETRVLVGATRVDTGEIEYFDSHCCGGLTYEHVAASGSLPPQLSDDQDRGSVVLGRWPVLKHAPESCHQRPGGGGQGRCRRCPGAHRGRAIPDESPDT